MKICWGVLIQILFQGLFCWCRRLAIFLRSKPVLRSKSYLRSRPDLLLKLTPTPSGSKRTIQPLSLAPLLFLLPWIIRLTLWPNEIFLAVSTKTPPRLMFVAKPLKCLYLNAKNNGLLQSLLGCFLESSMTTIYLLILCARVQEAACVCYDLKWLKIAFYLQEPCKIHKKWIHFVIGKFRKH